MCYVSQLFVEEDTNKPNVILGYDMVRGKLTIYVADSKACVTRR
jgi:hypothetical protein